MAGSRRVKGTAGRAIPAREAELAQRLAQAQRDKEQSDRERTSLAMQLLVSQERAADLEKQLAARDLRIGQLEADGHIDTLTKLPNLKGSRAVIDRVFEEYKRELKDFRDGKSTTKPKGFSFGFADLNCVKAVNDCREDHSMGDAWIIGHADAMRAVIRAVDHLFRKSEGGDEFYFIFSGDITEPEVFGGFKQRLYTELADDSKIRREGILSLGELCSILADKANEDPNFEFARNLDRSKGHTLGIGAVCILEERFMGMDLDQPGAIFAALHKEAESRANEDKREMKKELGLNGNQR